MSDSKTPRTDSTEERDMTMLAEQLETELNEAIHLVHFLSQYVESHSGLRGELAGCSVTDSEYEGLQEFLKKNGRIRDEDH